MKGFCVLVNDFGEDIILTTCPPALIKQMLHDGVLRQLGVDAGRVHDVTCRVCYDVVSSQLRSS
eukprot:473380-Pyramimonas_sp.AAC.1